MQIPVPPAEDDQVRRARDIERTAQEQAAARSAEATTIGAGGLVVKDGGSIRVESPGTIDLPGGSFSANTITATTNVTAGGTVKGASVVSTGGASVAGTASVGALSSGGGVSGAQGTFSSGLSSAGAYGTDVSLMPGGRQDVWQHISGVYGYAPSTIDSKTNLSPVPFTAADVLAVLPYMYQYRGQLAIRDDPANEYYDPSYVVPWEIGLIAEQLVAHNMACFVVFHEDGVTPKTIDYASFGAIAPLVVLADHEARLHAAGI